MFSEITPRLAVASAFDDLPSGWELLDVRGLIDGPSNSSAAIESCVADGLGVLNDPERRLVVVCDYGQSRSNYIAARIYAQSQNVTIDEAIAAVRSAHKDSAIHPMLAASHAETRRDHPVRRIAVTGGRGFVGRRLCTQLQKSGFDCRALSRSTDGDYLDSSDSLHETLAETHPDLLIHFAHPKPVNSEQTLQLALNQLISVAVYCENHQVSLLYPSGWVVFDGAGNENATSESPVRPHTRYGRLKCMIESYLREAAKDSLNVRIIRLPGMYGSDSLEPRFLRYFADSLRSGNNIVFHEFRNGSARVPLVAVDQGVEAIAATVSEFQDLPLITHVGCTEPAPSVMEIAATLVESTGISAAGTAIDRETFTGHFTPNLRVPGDSGTTTAIKNFILQLCRESDDRQSA